MAAKAKGVCLAGTVEHDGKRYAPGMPVPLPKDEALRLTNKLGTWEGEPIEGDPVEVRGAKSRRNAPQAAQSTLTGEPLVVMSQEQFAAVVEALTDTTNKRIDAFVKQMDTLIADASSSAAAAVIESLNAETETDEEPEGEASAPDLLSGDDTAKGEPQDTPDTSAPAESKAS